MTKLDECVIMNHEKKFIYTDHKVEKIIFECEAEDILSADQMIKQSLSIDVVKSPWIGCQVVKLGVGK